MKTEKKNKFLIILRNKYLYYIGLHLNIIIDMISK